MVDRKMTSAVEIASALGEPNRLRALLALRHGELCVCQITELLALAPSTVSKHLTVLKQAGLVQSRKSGRWIHYFLPDAESDSMVAGALEWAQRSMAGDPQVAADDRALDSIRQMDKEVLCRQQRRD